MRISRRRLSFAAAAACFGLIAAFPAFAPRADAQRLERSMPWIMPFDVGQPLPSSPAKAITSQRQVYDFMWESFVAINWPQLNSGNRAQPDRNATLAHWGSGLESEGPVVWQSYRRPNEVFVKPKQWPIRWNDTPNLQSLCTTPGIGQPMTVNSFSTNYSDFSDGLNQPFIQANYPTGPVTDQNGNYLRYEVGMNQAYFTYVGRYRYYNANKQVRAVARYIDFVEKRGKAPAPSNKRKAKRFQPLPNGTEAYLSSLPDYARQGIVEWKAAWKILGGDDVPERFYRRAAYFLNPDGSCVGPYIAGLVGLHIHRVTKNGGHIGATFEQVDNTSLQPEYSSRRVPGAAGLPPHASLNPGGENPPAYPNGYAICGPLGIGCQSGIGGNLPAPIKDGAALPGAPQITNVVRAVPIPAAVEDVNAKWRSRLKGSVWFYYQMIGAQNRNIDVPNPDLGPGVRGAQVSNTTNLINTTLESYTQRGWSCAQCHQNAFPLGVSQPLPPFGQAWDPLHTISFLLQNAQTNK